MSFGVPCVGTNVGGIPSIITDGINGYIVDSDDEEMLFEKLKECKINIFDKNKIKEKILSKYSWKKSAEEFKEVFGC